MTRTRDATVGGFIIATEEDETLFRAYTAARDRIRTVMGTGVFPNIDLALNLYANLDRDLAADGVLADDDLRAYHELLMGPITPYIADIRIAAQAIREMMQAIEVASPGTFGVPTPSPLTIL